MTDVLAPLDLPLTKLRRRRSEKWSTYPDDVLPLWVAELDVDPADPVRFALQEALNTGDLGYCGDGEGLSQAFARFCAERWQWQVAPDDVFPAADVHVAAAGLIRALTKPGDPVLYMPPVYPPFPQWIRDAGARPLPVQLTDDRRMDLTGIERALSGGCKVILLCNPHNPTGVLYPREELNRLVDLATRFGATILADEIHAPLALPGNTFQPLLGIGDQAQACTVALHSASKAWNLAGLKSAQMIAISAPTRAVVTPVSEQLSSGAGHLGMIAAEAAYRDGGPWLDLLLEALQHNVTLLTRLLDQTGAGIGFPAPQATYLAWLDLRSTGLGEDPARFFLDQARVALIPGPAFGPGGEGFARLNFGCSAELLESAVTRMAENLMNRT